MDCFHCVPVQTHCVLEARGTEVASSLVADCVVVPEWEWARSSDLVSDCVVLEDDSAGTPVASAVRGKWSAPTSPRVTVPSSRNTGTEVPVNAADTELTDRAATAIPETDATRRMLGPAP